MKNKILFILSVLFAVNAGYSGSQYNQNARSKCPYIYSIATGRVFNENGIIGHVDSWGEFKSDKFIGRVDCYGLVRDNKGKILGSVIKHDESPIYSKNQDESRERLLYVSRPKADGSVIVRTFDGSEFEPKEKGFKAKKEVDRWYTNWTILRNMENVFVNGICKTEYEKGFQVTSDFRIENTTTESKKDSVKYNVAKNAKAIIHNHPADDNKSHAWPSLTDIISGLKNPDKGCYIVDCYDKATLIRFDQETGKIHKIQDGGHEVIAENLEPNFQNVPAYMELKKELEKVTTMEELEALLKKKAPDGMGYKHTYGNMPYVPADFELLKKKFMSLRAAEKNKSGTLQNASSEVGVGAVKGDIAKTDVDEAKAMGDKCDVIKAIEQLISCMKERNAAVDSVSRRLPKRSMSDIRGILSGGDAISAESARYAERVEKCIETLNVSFLKMEKEFSNDSTVQINAIREKRYNSIKPHIIELFEILRDSPDKIRHRVENVIPIQLARYLVNCDNRIRKKYYLLPSFGFEL